MISRIAALVALAIASFSVGCVPGSYHAATPIEEGTLELGGALGIGGYSRDDDEDEYYDLIDDSSLYFLMYDVFLRYGIGAWGDIGVQLNYVGPGGSVRADLNVSLINTESFALSIDPAVQMLGTFDKITRLSGTAGIFVDFYKTRTTIFSLNVKPGYVFTSSRSSFASQMMIGGGFLIRHLWSKAWGENWVTMPYLDVNAFPGASKFYIEYHGGVAIAYQFR